MSKRIIFSEEEKKDINNTGRTVLVIGPTSDGKSRLIQTIHPKETGGYGLNEIFDADVTREKIRLKDKDGNVMFPNDYLRKAKKWVMKFESASKQKQDREAVENATTISKTSIRHKKTSQKTQDGFLDTDILELGGDVFAKGDTFNEQDIVTLFKQEEWKKSRKKKSGLHKVMKS